MPLLDTWRIPSVWTRIQQVGFLLLYFILSVTPFKQGRICGSCKWAQVFTKACSVPECLEPLQAQSHPVLLLDFISVSASPSEISTSKRDPDVKGGASYAHGKGEMLLPLVQAAHRQSGLSFSLDVFQYKDVLGHIWAPSLKHFLPEVK